MKTVLYAACFVSLLNGQVSADIYEVVISGQLTRISDDRDEIFDSLAGTVWGLDSYTPAVGDDWSYSILLNTDVLPDFMSEPGDVRPFAWYPTRFASSLSLAGRTVDGFASSLQFNGGPAGGSVFFISEFSVGFANLGLSVVFSDPNLISDLINGGNVFTSDSQFDQLGFSGMQIGDATGIFSFQAEPGSAVQVTVNQVPMPSTLTTLGLCCLIGVRRRR